MITVPEPYIPVLYYYLLQVDEFGNPKAKKPAKVPQFYEITEVIYALLNAGQEIPLPLWAKLIKFGLINIKAEDQRKREGTAADKDKTAKGSGTNYTIALPCYVILRLGVMLNIQPRSRQRIALVILTLALPYLRYYGLLFIDLFLNDIIHS